MSRIHLNSATCSCAAPPSPPAVWVTVHASCSHIFFFGKRMVEYSRSFVSQGQSPGLALWIPRVPCCCRQYESSVAFIALAYQNASRLRLVQRNNYAGILHAPWRRNSNTAMRQCAVWFPSKCIDSDRPEFTPRSKPMHHGEMAPLDRLPVLAPIAGPSPPHQVATAAAGKLASSSLPR